MTFFFGKLSRKVMVAMGLIVGFQPNGRSLIRWVTVIMCRGEIWHTLFTSSMIGIMEMGGGGYIYGNMHIWYLVSWSLFILFCWLQFGEIQKAIIWYVLIYIYSLSQTFYLSMATVLMALWASIMTHWRNDDKSKLLVFFIRG
jgi:hypothetical protein